jgi:hypothetical protein
MMYQRITTVTLTIMFAVQEDDARAGGGRDR